MKDAGKYDSYSDGGLPNGPYQDPAPRTISPNDGEREPSLGMPAPAMHASFIAAYYKACDSSQPGDWFDAALAAKQWEYSVRATLAAASPDGAGVPVAPTLGASFEPTMDIYAKPGTVVRFRGAGGYDGEKASALKAGFVKNALYTVKRCDVGRSHTDVLFDEIPGRWNSCLFADLAAPQAQPEPSDAADDVHALIDKAITSARRDQIKLTSESMQIASEARNKAIRAARALATPQPEPSVQPPAEASEPKYSPPYIGPAHTERGGKVELWPHQYKEDLLRMHRMGWYDRAALATPQPPAPVVPLADAEILGIAEDHFHGVSDVSGHLQFARAIEAARKIGDKP